MTITMSITKHTTAAPSPRHRGRIPILLMLSLLSASVSPFGIGVSFSSSLESDKGITGSRHRGVIRGGSASFPLPTSSSSSPAGLMPRKVGGSGIVAPLPAIRTSIDGSTDGSSIRTTVQQGQPTNDIATSSLNTTTATSESPLGNADPATAAGSITGKEIPNGQTNRGEYSSNLFSKLTYHYTSPLLRLASKRRLEVEDAFILPSEKKMDTVVKSLGRVYKMIREKEELKNIRKSRIRNRNTSGATMTGGSESGQISGGGSRGEFYNPSVVLVKSLLLHQRKTLLRTGLLRLINTVIQAFPAILVSRLLRLIESNAAPSQSLGAALTLIVVLSVKMLIENQYFHAVVKCATEVRGMLGGVIFEKSLRLPVGGSSSDNIQEKTKKRKKKKKNVAPISGGVGAVLNLMQSDASVMESCTLQIHTIWDGPLQIAIYTSLLYKYLGKSVLYGIAVLLLTIPMNSITLRLSNKLARLENASKEARTKRTTEAVGNMRLLKLLAWENTFAKSIQENRNLELNQHIRRGAVRALNSALSNAVPAIVLVVTLTAYSKTGQPIVASTIFTAISLFNQLRFPLFFYPMLIDSLANGKNSLRRIGNYLDKEEITEYVVKLPSEGGGRVEMKNGNYLWPATVGVRTSSDTTDTAPCTSLISKPALRGVNLTVYPGEIIAVVGTVGSGKTALIKSLLGELSPVPPAVLRELADDGKIIPPSTIMDVPSVVHHGPVSYCAQEAWLSKGTVRDAILFGRGYDSDNYQSALRDAGLSEDMSDGTLSHETDVGEGGLALSGGQRARVALARALYGGMEAGVYLLDDPLAALDASVGSAVLERIRERVRVTKSAALLVTNDPNVPRRCDRVVLMGKVMASGAGGEEENTCSTILDVGSYDELIDRGHNLRQLVEDQHAVLEEVSSDEDDNLNGDAAIQQSQDPSKLRNIQIVNDEADTTSLLNNTSIDYACHADPDNCQVNNIAPDQATFIPKSDEHVKSTSPTIMPSSTTLVPKKLASLDDTMSTGAVPRSTYITYIQSVRKPLLIFSMLLAYGVTNSAQFFQQYIVAKWTEIGTTNSMSVALGAKYLNTLFRAACVVSVALWTRSYITTRVGSRASRHLHERMLQSVFHAPMSFFDATPSGQILGRFGKEMDTVDRALPDGIGSVIFCFLQIGLSAVALSGVISPIMFLPLVVIGKFYGDAMGRFRPAARDLKRCESRTRGPIVTHFGEALKGTETIRSVPSARTFWASTNRHYTDENLSVFYSVKSLDRWLSIRLESLGNVGVLATAVAAVYLSRSGKLKAGAAGWGLTQALSVTGLLTWAVRVLTDLETQMMSVLRIEEITDLTSTSSTASKMPRELSGAGEALRYIPGADSIRLKLTPEDDTALMATGWPWEGGIEFNNISMRYNPVSPLVLKNVTINVAPGTTLGVVGRTGSGKSSLLYTLFRLVEPEGNSSISIDGVDIRSVTLQNLRQSLSIIPQNPVLFAGTVMYNLDATLKASPNDAWAALRAASPDLALQFQKSQMGLNSLITEGGNNLSLGQRQLVCLARALLRKSKILVMDEATSSVDTETDSRVQDTIRREFVDKGVTVITVAHRLDTVLGYDKIAVMGNGELLEYGTPSDLLSDARGELRKLVEADSRNKKRGLTDSNSAGKDASLVVPSMT